MPGRSFADKAGAGRTLQTHPVRPTFDQSKPGETPGRRVTGLKPSEDPAVPVRARGGGIEAGE